MRIEPSWLINYIKNNGTNVIIPKDATVIYELGRAMEKIKTMPEYEDGIEITFEEESQIEEIQDRAFCGCTVKNTVIIPRSIKKIGCGAFSMGNSGDFRLERNSEIEECSDVSVFANEEIIYVPHNLNYLITNIEYCKKAKKIVMPNDIKAKRISIIGENSISDIETANGSITFDDNENFGELEIEDNLYYLTYKKRLENGEVKTFFAVLDRITLQKIFEAQLLQRPYSNIDGLVLEYDNIWACELEKINNITHNIYIYLKSDENAGEKREETALYAEKGKIYAKEEIKGIQDKLKEIISKINVPPPNVKDREKIIYAQIVKQLSEYLEYDYESAAIIDETNNSTGERYYYDEETQKQIDETQNLKGLLSEKTVCKGMATIVQALCAYYNIDCKVIKNEEHAWNLVKLDGEYYEDDFTWYQSNLQTSNILGMNEFLKGKDEKGKREFERLNYHETTNIDVELSTSLEKNKRFNLLATDWSMITNWENVNIDRPIPIFDYMEQIATLAKSKKSMCLLANKRLLSRACVSLKTFCEKVKNFFRNRGNNDDGRE